ncbi:MAG: HPr family phosphocarrier protein [Elusimicrobiota bacterium]
MQKKKLEVTNDSGLHARAAAKLVERASKFESDIIISKNGLEVDGKSIMGILTLAVNKGSKILVKINGDDEKEALAEIEKLVKGDFGE